MKNLDEYLKHHGIEGYRLRAGNWADKDTEQGLFLYCMTLALHAECQITLWMIEIEEDIALNVGIFVVESG